DDQDIDAAISYFQDVLTLRPDPNPDRAASLVNLASAFQTRYDTNNDPTDLDGAVKYYKEAQLLYPSDHVDRHASLNGLGFALQRRFDELGNMDDLQSALAYHQEALTLLTPDHPLRCMTMGYVGNVLLTRFEEAGNTQDLDTAIHYFQEALALRPPGHPDRLFRLNNLASALLTRFEQTARPEDLDESITCNQEVLVLCQPGDPERPACLNALATSLETRFRQTNNREDLDLAVTYLQEAMSLCPPGHTDRPLCLNNLSNTLRTRSLHTGSMEDLDLSIEYLEEVLQGYKTAQWHRDKSMTLTNLAISLQDRYNRLGRMVDIERTIQSYSAALQLRPPGNPDRHTSLNGLALALIARFQRTADMSDLDLAIKYHKGALSLRPVGHRGRSLSLSSIADALRTKFDISGDLADLNDALRHYQDADSLRPVDHPDRHTILSGMGDILKIRFEYARDLKDLDNSILLHKDAVRLCPTGHFNYLPVSVGYAQVLQTRFEETHQTQDLDAAVTVYRAVLSSALDGHPHRYAALTGLSRVFSSRFQTTSDKADLDLAIEYCEASVEACPGDHPQRPTVLNSAANTLQIRFKENKDLKDLERVISYRREASNLCPQGHPRQCGLLDRLAMCLFEQYQHASKGDHNQNLEANLTNILELLRNAAEVPASPSIERLHASCDWIMVTRHANLGDINPYLTMFELLDITIARGHSLESQHHDLSTSEILKRAKGYVHEAVSLAIEQGDVELAIQFLERGKAMLLGRLAQYRTSLDELHVVNPELASKFSQLSKQLDVSAYPESHHPVDPDGERIRPNSAEDDVARYQRLSAEWTKTVEEIRALDGFRLFLRPPLFVALAQAAIGGPIVLINTSSLRSDAIIVQLVGTPLVVGLSEYFTPEKAVLLSQRIKKPRDRDLLLLLEELWELVVEPIVKVLQDVLKLPRKGRIWWCPTGAASKLPFHAAGLYRKNTVSLPELYISSYTPTLGALVRARERPVSTPHLPTVLVVGQPDTPGQVELPAVPEEVQAIKKQYRNARILEGRDGTRDVVLGGIAQHEWIHLSCHGHINDDNPLRSSFSLYDQPLHLIQLVEQHLPHAELAVLSACHSAAGDRNTPDEFLHLAAAMQFAGFRSVVGTLWAMTDADGPTLTREFYKHMLKGAEKKGYADCSKAAISLREAVKVLRTNKVPATRWVNFVHFGI
ncbi:hypothetical protein FRB99_002165, partial [Tulasnella sp. 403]